MTKAARRTLISGALALMGGLVALFAPSAMGVQGPAGLSVRWSAARETNYFIVEVGGLGTSTLQQLSRANWSAKEWNQLLAVYAGQGDLLTDVRMPPMSGSYQVNSSGLRFEPQFPLVPGVRYSAVFRPGKLPDGSSTNAPITSFYEIPLAPAKHTTVVRQIYPTADRLPENLLKFYVHFSAAMSRGHIYDHIRLRAENGKAVELPFLEIDEELWDPSLTRLTLFIDPGRIKRGVRPLEEIGPALEQGKRYALVIDQEWKDATGNSLAEAFEKRFVVGAPDREPLDPKQWKLQEPKAGSEEALEVRFPKPVDHALAQRLIRVYGPAVGRDTGTRSEVDGRVTLLDQERRWRFSPDRQWTAGQYTLQIETTLEDLAGNNIGKPFEVDLFEGVQRRITNSVANLPFRVR